MRSGGIWKGRMPRPPPAARRPPPAARRPPPAARRPPPAARRPPPAARGRPRQQGAHPTGGERPVVVPPLDKECPTLENPELLTDLDVASTHQSAASRTKTVMKK